MITRAFRSLFDWYRRLWPSRSRIQIDLDLWQEIVQELGRRSLGGSREAGVFLLVPREEGARRVVRAAYFDDPRPRMPGWQHSHSSLWGSRSSGTYVMRRGSEL